MNNLRKLEQISHLENGWNGNKARAFEKDLISKVRGIITALEIQPEIFPTACDSIQFEYEKTDGAYLEIQINSSDKWEVFEVDRDGKEKNFSILSDIEAIVEAVSSIYG